MLPIHREDDDSARKRPSLSRRVGLLSRQLLTQARSLPRGLFALLIASSLALGFLVVYVIPRAISEHGQLSAALEQWRQWDLPADTIPVLIPTYSRPAYLASVIESLRNANNVDKTVLVFSQDGAVPAVTELIQSVNFTRVIHLRHSPPFWGLPSRFLRTDAPTAANVFFLLRFAFEWARVPAAVVLESDIVLAPDGLDYFKWAFTETLRDEALRDRTFTINGYYERSQRENDPHAFTTDEFGFMVWGWLCPGYSWERIRGGWTWWGNWDITMEALRRASVSPRTGAPLVSLSPVVSRTRNIGMQGINFDVRDPADIAKWTRLYIPEAPISYMYAGASMRMVAGSDDAAKRKPQAA